MKFHIIPTMVFNNTLRNIKFIGRLLFTNMPLKCEVIGSILGDTYECYPDNMSRSVMYCETCCLCDCFLHAEYIFYKHLNT